MKCLDSDILVAILRGDKSAMPYMEKIDTEGKTSTTSISAYEILFGARISKNPKNVEESIKLLAKLSVLPFDEKAAEKASEIHSDLRQKGQEVSLKDMFIASVAITNGSHVITRNTKDFLRIKEVKVEKW